jgi:prepilin-type N-terminal cleavage/methylation domain-containing protein
MVKKNQNILMGFTLVELMMVVAIIGLLVSLTVPNFVKSRNSARRELCHNNLKLICNAAEQYIIDNDLSCSAVVTMDQASKYVNVGVPECPSGGAYAIGTEMVGDNSGPVVTCVVHGTYHMLSGKVS